VVLRLGDLADKVGGEVRGDPEHPIEGIRPLSDAGPEHLSLLTDPRYRDAARESRAGALLIPRGPRGEKLARGLRGASETRSEPSLLLVDDPVGALTCILPCFHPERRPAPGIDPTAVVDPEAEVDPSVHVGPYVVVGAGSRLAAEVVVEAHVAIGRDCRVGEGSWLHPHAVLYDRTEIGRRCIVHSGAVLGADGFRYAFLEGMHRKVPQVGHVTLGDDVEVGALSALDRGSLGATRIGDGAKIDNLVQVAHNVEVGRGALLCGQAGIAGSTRLGDGVVLAGQAGVADHVRVGDGVRVAAKSAVLGDVEPGLQVGGIPAVPLPEWRRRVARMSRLEDFQRRIEALERRVATLHAEEEKRRTPEEGEST
jgi:UDP-3-O-[3-hydroxymyristoyl] glucosamine N-acyltransferase